MKIKRVLNNNVVVSLDGKGQEIIVMGCGIAFQKKPNDIVNKSKVEKVFVLEDQMMIGKFQQLLDEVPMEYMTITDRIIKYTEEKFNKPIKDIVYLSITDHIYNSALRFKGGVGLKNGLLWDIKRLYKEEFEVGLYALTVIQEEVGIEFPEDEAAYIATHIVNARLNEEIPIVMNMTKMTQEILNIVKYHYRMELDEESLAYSRFVTHLKFFAQRLFNNKKYVSQEDDELYNIVKLKYKDAYECAKKIDKFLELEYNYKLTHEEELYLIIHIERVVEKHK